MHRLLATASPRMQALAIFPLSTVLFPDGVLPLRIFEQRYMDMIKDCLRDDKVFGVCLIREGQEVGGPAVPEPVGCTARIVDWDMQQLGVLHVRTIGEQRFTIDNIHATAGGLLIADVELISADDDDGESEDLESCAGVLRRIVESVGEERFNPPLRFDQAAWVGNRLAEVLPIPMPIKQKLMELTDPLARLKLVAHFMRRHGILAK